MKIMQLNWFISRVLNRQTVEKRMFSKSSVWCQRDPNRDKHPYDKRFGVHPKDTGPTKRGGSYQLASKLGRGGNMPQMPGYINKKGHFVFVKEMVPEFVVPDLKDFELQPYVSYKVADIVQSEFTARDLFNATYAKPIVEDFKRGKVDIADIKNRIDKIKSTGHNQA